MICHIQIFKIKKCKDGLDFLGYIIRPQYTLTRKRVVKNFKYKKAKFLAKYEQQNGKMPLLEIERFNQVLNSFKSHINIAIAII